jgi:hypothetical protein
VSGVSSLRWLPQGFAALAHGCAAGMDVLGRAVVVVVVVVPEPVAALAMP